MAGGQNCWGKGLWKGARGWGQEGWGRGWANDWGGEGGGERGWGEALIEVLNQNRYHYIQFGYRNAYYETKSAEIAIFGEFPQFLAGNPHVMTSHSRKNVMFLLRK